MAKTVELKRDPVATDAKNVVLGDRYTDSVTDISGVAIIVYIHLTGCDQVCLSYVAKDEQKYITVDATRLKELQLPDDKPARRGAGGPGEMPMRVPQ
jgi:hypothetical protein